MGSDPVVQGEDRSFGSSKRKIKREVSSKERKRRRKNEKRKKRKGGGNLSHDDLDDFIASDSEDEYRHYDYFDLKNDDDTVPSPTKSTTSTSSRTGGNTMFETLSNVILLCGSVGSGKTSTVYAVAKELGWQVFEVYPGIGKRGSKDIDKYVGMVGQNHIVKKETTSTAKNANGLAGIFRKKQQAIDLDGDGEEGSDKQPADNNSDSAKALSATSSIAQSVVLIEEVDLLYPSDQGFWEGTLSTLSFNNIAEDLLAGVISFISKSKRPVILTCNGTQLSYNPE